MKFILHIDMNAFFASVEELQNPKYINSPIAVSGKTKRSVIASANYIARAKGVKAAMPVYQALNLCPNLIIVIPHFNLYQLYSQKILQLIEEKFTTRIEPFSIDECYADISNLASDKQSAFKVATKIQSTIFNELKLKCSIGISTNKFLAKMASDFKKPFGISTLYVEEIEEKLWPLDINEML
jgi:DNA polymerase-4